MRAYKLLFTVFTGLAVLAVAAVAALFLVDPSAYRNQIENRASAAFGRQFRVGGAIHLEKSLRPRIILHDITIANPHWAKQPDFIAAEQVSVQVALIELLHGDLRILDVAFAGVHLSVEENPDGGNNYTLDSRGDDGSPAVMPALERLAIKNSVINYRAAEGGTQDIQIGEAKLWNIPGKPQRIEGHGSFKGKSFTFSLAADTVSEQGKGKNPWSVKLALKGRDMALTIAGRLAEISAWQQGDYQVDVSGNDTTPFEPLLGADLPATGPFELSARITRDETSFQVTDIDALVKVQPDTPAIKISAGEVNAGRTEPLKAVLRGQFGDIPLALTIATTKPFASLSQTAWPMTAELELAGMKLSVKGHKQPADATERISFDMQLQGETLDPVAQLLKVKLPKAGPYRLSFHTEIGTDSYTFTNLKGSIAGTNAWDTIAILGGKVSALDSGAVQASIDTKLDSTPLSLNLQSNLLASGKSDITTWPIKLEASTSGVTLTGEGSIVSAGNQRSLKMTTRVQGNRLTSLNPLLGTSLPAIGKFDWQADVSTDGDLHSAENLAMQMGGNRFRGHVRWQDKAPRPVLTLKLSSKHLMLDRLFAPSSKIAARGTETDLLDLPVELGGLSDFDARLDLAVERLADAPIDVRNLRSTVTLTKGRLDIPIHASVLGIPAEAHIRLRENKQIPAISFKAKAKDVDVGQVLKQLKLPTIITGTAEAINLDASGTGETVRTLAGQATVDLQIKPARLLYTADMAGQTVAIQFQSGTLAARKGQPLTGHFSGVAQGAPVNAKFSTAHLEALHKANSPLPVRLSIETENLQFKSEGTVARPFKKKAFDLRYELKGTEIEELGPLADFAIPLSGEFRARGRVTGRGDRLTVIDDLRVGQSTLKAEITVSQEGPRPKITGDISANKLHVDDVDIFDANKQTPAARHPTRVIPDYTLPLDALFAVDLDLLIKATRIQAPFANIGEFDSKISLKNGRFKSLSTLTGVHGARINTEFSVNAAADPPPVKVRMKAESVDFGYVLNTLGASDLVRGQGEVHVDVSGTGATRYTFLGNAAGRITIIGGPGQIAGRSIDLWAADLIPTMLSTSWQREAVTATNCMVAHIELKEGVAEVENLLVDTQRITVAGSGTMDLMTEGLDLVFAPRPKRVSLVSLANPVRITGTLAKPQISVTHIPGGSRLTTGASLVAGLINPIFLIFAFSDTGTGQANPCESAVKETREAAGIER